MDDAAARRHPLDVARADRAVVAQTVAVIDVARQHVGNRLDAAMRMPRKPCLVVGGTVVPEVVEQQKRVEVFGIAESKRALQLDAGALDSWRRGDVTLDGSDGHQRTPLLFDAVAFHADQRSRLPSHCRARVMSSFCLWLANVDDSSRFVLCS